DAAIPVVAHPSVANRWTEASALEAFTIGGLAGHLYRSVRRLEQVLDDDPPVGLRVVTAAEYYGNAKVANRTDFESALHRGIRDAGEQTAARGPDRLTADFAAVVERLRVRL